jgi:hypothetical protein
MRSNSTPEWTPRCGADMLFTVAHGRRNSHGHGSSHGHGKRAPAWESTAACGARNSRMGPNGGGL